MRGDAVLILGKELRRDPERARRELQARAAAAAALHRRGVQPIHALESRLRGQSDSGSRLLARYLGQLGVPSQDLELSEVTHSTREEALEAAALVRSRGYSRLLVITSSYHVSRARQLFAAALPSGSFEVIAPENLLHGALPAERDWILQGSPDERTLDQEGRLETLLSLLGGTLSVLPGGAQLERAAGRLWRRT